MKALFLFCLLLTLSLFHPKAQARGEVFKMYPEPAAEVNPSCDVYTQLILNVTVDGKATATLENKLGGQCELYVAPNRKNYNLTLSRENCGTRFWVGETKGRRLTVIDHRLRRCGNDFIAARIITNEVQLKGEDNQVYRLYSKDE